MKTYEIIRSESGQVWCSVQSDGTSTLLQHCIYHSPTGFETGYNGSGPADLALSILADFNGTSPKSVQKVIRALQNPDVGSPLALKGWDGRDYGKGDVAAQSAVRCHHLFKVHFIAPRQLKPGESYTITSAEISGWAMERLQKTILRA